MKIAKDYVCARRADEDPKKVALYVGKFPLFYCAHADNVFDVVKFDQCFLVVVSGALAVRSDAYALLVLLENQMVAVDLNSEKYPDILAPYLTHIHAPIIALELHQDVGAGIVRSFGVEVASGSHDDSDDSDDISETDSSEEAVYKPGDIVFISWPKRHSQFIPAYVKTCCK